MGDIRPTNEHLIAAQAEWQVQPGETWMHNVSTDTYVIVAVSHHEADHAPMVTYRLADGSGPNWTRPMRVFLHRFWKP